MSSKIKLIVEFGDFPGWFTSLDEKRDMLNNQFKDEGLSLHEEYEALYYETEVNCIPIEGQRVLTRFGEKIVKFSVLALEDDSSCFDSRSRIVVIDE